MASTEHLFISNNGDMLPRWRSAFVLAEAVPVRVLSNVFAPDYAWLRLQSGIPVAAQVQGLRRHLPDPVLIVLSDTPSDDEGMEAFSAGARGYCNSHASEAVLRQVFNVVSQGGLWIGESLMERLLVGIMRLPAAAESPAPAVPIKNGWHDKLTEREWEVARAIAAGASNKEVARQLGITERTVKAHVGVIFTKLEVQDRLHLALRIRQLH
jgi:DNA-binding NarL/FixJ family response regulator